MAWGRVEEKFHALAATALAPGRRETVIKAVKRLDEIAVRDLAALLD
jgi:hypothetical protein